MEDVNEQEFEELLQVSDRILTNHDNNKETCKNSDSENEEPKELVTNLLDKSLLTMKGMIQTLNGIQKRDEAF